MMISFLQKRREDSIKEKILMAIQAYSSSSAKKKSHFIKYLLSLTSCENEEMKNIQKIFCVLFGMFFGNLGRVRKLSHESTLFDH
jgi:hypothetical protein